ncbi:hypothetical protein [uncultured Moraxella sp.]|uniref:hypothetical protein n=1 Tax=uncultured Moraxella sp. TaxID=263769 RepID=UPI0025EEE0DF|nr:hypothetical protein [uncultured Moraxella sp.]
MASYPAIAHYWHWRLSSVGMVLVIIAPATFGKIPATAHACQAQHPKATPANLSPATAQPLNLACVLGVSAHNHIKIYQHHPTHNNTKL